MAQALLLLLAVSVAAGTQFQKCEKKFKKIGCYENGRPNYDSMLFSSRDSIQWENIEAYMAHTACKCDQAVVDANKERSESEQFVGFSLHNWGECFGKTQNELDALELQKPTHRCTGDQNYNGCKTEHDVCIGHHLADYIYLLSVAAEQDINGGYSEWEAWTPCKGECGSGLMARERTCTNPLPKGKGKDCSSLGKSTETKVCQLKNPCPINGGYSNWSSYSACSKSCGGGIKTRSRSCTKPKPEHGGKNCNSLGASNSTAACNENACLSAERQRIGCAPRRLSLQCRGNSRITITYAMYGRLTNSICRGSDLRWSTKCNSSQSLPKVKSRCEGKKSCSVYARNNVFGDPCPGTRKYLQIKYRCKG